MISAATLSTALRNYFVDALAVQDVAVRLQQDDAFYQADPAPAPWLDSPPPVVPSFAEHIREIADAMAPLKHRPEPRVMTWIDCYDAAGDDTYLGRLYIDATTGREYKFEQMGGKVIYL